MFDVVCIGSAVIDAFLTLHEANNYCRINSSTGELCIKSGEKIPLEDAQFELGGNACNVAVGLARLGLHSGLLAEMGNDAFSHRIRKDLESEHVGLSHVISSDTPSSLSIAINFQGERTLFTQHFERSHHFVYDSIRTKWIYLTSIGEKWRHVYHEVPAYIKRTGVKLALNPGSRQIAAGREAIIAALAVTEVLFVNKEEAQIISGQHNDDIATLAKQLQVYGAKNVVITDGEKGAFVLDAQGTLYQQGIVETKVIEKTGAGDSFASGFLAALVYDYDIPTAMKWGMFNAASVIGKIGAQPGLLTKEQMEKRYN